MKFRTTTVTAVDPGGTSNGDGGGGGGGTRPLAEAASVSHVLGMMVVHLSRKIIYGVDISHKVGVYIIGTLVLSVVSDFTSKSTHYLARPDNLFNLYFVKFSWGWTLLLTSGFVFVTSRAYSCGRSAVMKNQFMRLIVATGVWYGLTGVFLFVEESSGICNVTKFLNKAECLAGGFRWKGFDISGHCFLLTFSSLFVIEEAKAYLGWERIKDMIRNEEHRRLNTDMLIRGKDGDSVLSKLSLDEFLHLRKHYTTLTPFVRALFCGLAALVLLWDVMLICTALFFHIMIEKVVATCAAVLTWFVLYRGIYVHDWSPGLPGETGPFKYVTFRPARPPDLPRGRRGATGQCDHHAHHQSRWAPKDDVPKFMGMPLYGYKKDSGGGNNGGGAAGGGGDEGEQGGSSSSKRYGRRPRSRSGSVNRFSASKNSLNARY